MVRPAFVFADRARAEQFTLLARAPRLFSGFDPWTDADGVTWAVKRVGNLAFAVTWLSPGWGFDPYASNKWAADLAARRVKIRAATEDQHRRGLSQILRRVRRGPHTERLLWLIHQEMVAAHSSLLQLPDFLLGAALWGQEQATWPRQWRQDLTQIL